MFTKKRSAKFGLVGLAILLLSSSIGGVFFPEGLAEAATPTPRTITYTPESNVISNLNRNSMKMSKNDKVYTQINEDAGSGNKIQKIVFYKGTTAVKTINVDAQTYNNKVELEAKKTKSNPKITEEPAHGSPSHAPKRKGGSLKAIAVGHISQRVRPPWEKPIMRLIRVKNPVLTIRPLRTNGYG